MKYNPNSLYYRLNPTHLEYLLSTEPSFPFTIGGVLRQVFDNKVCTTVWLYRAKVFNIYA